MVLIKHELKQGFKTFLIWTMSIGFLLIICIFMYPEMKDKMGDVSDMFSSMGSFTEAFGMDRINFGSLIGFYGVECGNILGIGGAFYASLIAAEMLSKEEKEHTAEFLFTHPISRTQVMTCKLISILIMITLLNITVWLLSAASIAIIGESIPWQELNGLHLSYLLMQYEMAALCFGISAFIRNKGLGVGLGLASIMYFLNIIANISDQAHFLKYITPFGYTEGADIISSHGHIDGLMLSLGMAYGVISLVIAYLYYPKKDLQ